MAELKAAQGSPDQHAGSAETLPPRSPSGEDESPDGGGEEDQPSPSPKRRRRKMVQPPRRLLPTPPRMEPIKSASDHGRQRRRAPAAKGVKVEQVVAAIEPWVRKQETFRKRQCAESFPHFEAELIRLALTMLGNAGLVKIEPTKGGDPVFVTLSNAPDASYARPANDANGTLEGAVLQVVTGRGGASLDGIAIAVGQRKTEVAPVISKLWREGDIRPETRAGARVYVAA